VRVQLNLNYATLANVNPPGPTVLRATYYIKLPLTLCALVNGNGMQYSITTFIGPGDLQTLSPPEVWAQILDLMIQGDQRAIGTDGFDRPANGNRPEDSTPRVTNDL
jgi:hypothetical protein